MTITNPVVLIVDDDPAHLLLTKRVVQGILPSIEIMSFAKGAEARLWLRKHVDHPIALALVDLNLGDESGLLMVHEMRDLRSRESVPLLSLSTSDLVTDIQAAYAAGADIYLTKSLHDAEFKASLSAAVRFLTR